MYNRSGAPSNGLTAISCHSFAGAFTLGVRDAGFHVPYQLEHLGFGYDTARHLNPGIEVVHGEQNWPSVDASLLFGNPRCNSFSALASVAKDEGRGCWGYQTADIHQLCNYGVQNKIPYIAWESLQAAYVGGRPLIRHLRDTLFWPNGYRIAHILLNAATHGNAQCRRRYFFLAFPADLDEVSMVVHPMLGIEPNFMMYFFQKYYQRRQHISSFNPDEHVQPYQYNQDYDVAPYGPDHYMDLTKDEWFALKNLRQGESLNSMAKRVFADRTREMLTVNQRATWIDRNSEVPFSLHAIKRPRAFGFMPTIYTGTKRLIHITKDRPMTFGEIAAGMGWPVGTVPVGSHPVEQIAKGVVPGCARWLGEIVQNTINGVTSDMAPNTCRDAAKALQEHVGFSGSKSPIYEEIKADPERREIIYDLTWWIPGRGSYTGSTDAYEDVECQDEE